MRVTHRNRKGDIYYLYRGSTKTGTTRYYFARASSGELVDAVPDGYEIVENLNGIVSLRKSTTPVITDEEAQIVRKQLDRFKWLRNYGIEVRQHRIIICEPVGVELIEALREMFGEFRLPPERLTKLAEIEERSTRYEPVLRFTLIDRRQRHFEAERMRYTGEGGWMPLATSGDLSRVAREYVRHLGTDAFFEMF